MNKYRMKPRVVEAVQWTGNNFSEICDFCGINNIQLTADGQSIIFSLHGGFIAANPGDYVVKDEMGVCHPSRSSFFKENFEMAEGQQDFFVEGWCQITLSVNRTVKGVRDPEQAKALVTREFYGMGDINNIELTVSPIRSDMPLCPSSAKLNLT